MMAGGAILVVAAEARELAAIASRCLWLEYPSWQVDFAAVGELNGRRLALVANGPGPELAAEATRKALSHAAIALVVSTGYCGALHPELQRGDIVAASRVEIPGSEAVFGASLPCSAHAFRSGVVFSLDKVVRNPGEKARLREAGAIAIEMEAAGVAAEAARAALPFFCIRSVLDRAEEGFALDFNGLRRADGRFSRWRIARAALARPGLLVPELIRIQRGCRHASRALGDFFGNCRFQS